jgi:hypothetical protein
MHHNIYRSSNIVQLWLLKRLLWLEYVVWLWKRKKYVQKFGRKTIKVAISRKWKLEEYLG